MPYRRAVVPSLLLFLHLGGAAEPAKVEDQPAALATPAQDGGMPYTRSARAAAIAALGDGVAVCVGSRLAWAQGHRLRLDDARWRDEAVERNGEIWVPAAFAPVVLAAQATVDAAPDYLADRWIHTARRQGGVPAGVRNETIAGASYVALADLAKAAGKPLARQGILAVIGGPKLPAGATLDAVVTLFDTPEKLADPAVAAKYVPTLARQGQWTDHVKATPEQIARFNGDPVAWPTAPKESYDHNGIDRAVLGSQVPAPGVYPRLLFSPEDLPAVQKRVKASILGQKSLIEMEELFKATWWDAKTSDGQLFDRLASGDISDQRWPSTAPDRDPKTDLPQILKDHKAGIYNSHVNYVPECLTAMATYALIQGDDALGRKAAAAIATWYRLIEPAVDAWNATSDSQWGSGSLNGGNGSSTAWRGMHGLIAHMNLGLSLDLAGKWMTPAEKDGMRRLIAKATYGRRAYSQDATVRFRDVNWCTWDLPNYLAVAAIEGLEGCDQEVLESNVETVRAFCDFGVDDQGVVFESTGKSPGAFQFFHMSLVIAARRGQDFTGHPHLRKLLTSQAQMTSPTGLAILNSGTQYSPYDRQFLSPSFAMRLLDLYPGDRAGDYLLGLQKPLTLVGGGSPDDANYWETAGFDPVAYRAWMKTAKRVRLPSPSYPGFVRPLLYSHDWKPTSRADTNLPLDYVAPTHGVLATRSDQTTDAAFISMMVRPNHYMGAGHHHSDAGMLHVAGLGQDWLSMSRFSGGYDGFLFSLVQVDGQSEPTNLKGVVNGYNGAATWLGATTVPGGAAAAADLTYAYSWRWMTQPPQIWSEALQAMPWEVEPSPRVQDIFAGLGRFKIRPWWSNHTFGNAIPTLRAPFNPMAHVYRTAALVRGERPYLVVTDDLQKDDKPHRYDWSSPLSGGVWKATVAGLPADQAVLAWRDPLAKDAAKEGTDRPAISPKPGEPMLLVASVGTPAVTAAVNLQEAVGQEDKKTGAAQYFERVVLGTTATAVNFRIVLIPFRAGEPLPKLTWDAATSTATVQIGAQSDRLVFRTAENRTRMSVERGGAAILTTP